MILKQGLILGLGGMICILGGCTPGNNVPGATATGAIAGGLIGNELFHGQGQVPGIIGSSLVGGIVGDQVGQSMNAKDQASSNAYYSAPPPRNYGYPNQYGYNNGPPARTIYVYPSYGYQAYPN